VKCSLGDRNRYPVRRDSNRTLLIILFRNVSSGIISNRDRCFDVICLLSIVLVFFVVTLVLLVLSVLHLILLVVLFF
jgi:hypothetical protein